MKKYILICVVCGLLLTGCGKAEESTVIAEQTETTVTTIQTDSPKITTTQSPKTTTVPNATDDVVSDMTTTTKTSTSAEVTTPIQTEKKPVNQGNNQNEPPRNDSQQSEVKPQIEDNKVVTEKPVTSADNAVTTKKPTVTETPTVVVDMSKVSDQMWTFLTFYPIDYDEMYQIGKSLNSNGSDYEKANAVCNYAYSLGGRNCIEYALNAYFLAKGAGLECYIARSEKYDWNGHVANIVKLDDKFYYMEPQSNIVGSPSTYAAGGTASDGSVISYPKGLDIVTDIYENRKSVTISSTWHPSAN